MKLQEAARALGVSERTLRKWLKAGRVSGVKVPGFRGKEWSIDAASVEEARKKAGSPEAEGVPAFRSYELGEEAETAPEKAGSPEVETGSLPALPPDLENRLARIEGALTGALVSELRAELQASREREEALGVKLDSLQEESRRREEALLEELRRIREDLAVPWWQRIWRRRK